jgi:hypothetical protein
MQQGDEGFGASVSTNEMDVSLNGINHQAGNVMGNANGVQVFGVSFPDINDWKHRLYSCHFLLF